MQKFARLQKGAIAVALFLCFPSVADARLMRAYSYDELLAKSDLIVVAQPSAKTADTAELTHFDDIATLGADGSLHLTVKAVGVQTTFTVLAVLKGNAATKTFILHHLRAPSSTGVSINGPTTVSFDPTDPKRDRVFLLFLIREKDGRYAPCGGQTDPGIMAISALETPP